MLNRFYSLLSDRLGRLFKKDKDRDFLFDLIPKNSVGAEIGVHLGDFSALCARRVEPRLLHLIDPWVYHQEARYKDAWYGGQAESGQREMDERYQKVLNRFEDEIKTGEIQVHRGYSGEVLNGFADAGLDWIYIDGNHLYEYVKADLELSFNKTKFGGLILGDDYHEGGWWEGGVKKAVDEFARRNDVELLAARNGQFAFRKK